ncbi:MAG: type II secretion system F family protein [Elusimicrobiales bacterium]|nr:type II secretion system F family protein [Elusimicrobiales bacterium]
MPRFIYTVQDSQGNVTTGSMESDDEDNVISNLQNKGYFILSIQSEKESAKGLFALRKKSGGKVSGREICFFGEQLSTLVAGGVPLVRALSLLSENSENKSLQSVLFQVTKDVSSGSALHKALEKHPQIFDDIWVSLVSAGEVSGQLPLVLRQITSYKETQEEIKGKIITAFAYPTVLLMLSMGVLFYFVIFIVPVFSQIFTDFGMKLPAITKAVMGFSYVVRNYWLIMIIVAIGGYWSFKSYIKTESGLLAWNKFQFSIPIVGGFIKSINYERCLTTMSTLLKSGVSIINSIAVLETAFKQNLIIQNALKKAKNDITSGKMISDSFKRSGAFPQFVTDMMLMGEESGKLPDMIDVLSVYYKEQMDQFLRRFSAMIDPLLMVIIGSVIGTVVMSVYIPIFQLSQIKGG